MEQDINTLASEVDEQRFRQDDLVDFLDQGLIEAKSIQALYFPPSE